MSLNTHPLNNPVPDSFTPSSTEPLLPFMVILEAYHRGMIGIKKSQLTKEHKRIIKLSKPLMIRVMELDKKPFSDVWIYEYNSILKEFEAILSIIIPTWDMNMDDLKVGK